MLRYKAWSVAALITAAAYSAQSQELFVYNEPASNMPAHSLGIRLTNMFYNGSPNTTIMQVPELMWGINKRLMVHGEAYAAVVESRYTLTGTGVYVKYRFYSSDKVHRHFRMAAFGRITSNNMPAQREELEANGLNAGWQAGLIATQLRHKTALSATAYYEAATGDVNSDHTSAAGRYALNYHLSAGRLVLPWHYTSYRQTNLNIMTEVMAQHLPVSGKYYVDIAPSVQVIINSQTRIDAGYRWQLAGDMERMARSSLMIRIEHLFFRFL